jgi:Protein of unknown function (DUF1579)
MRMHVAALALVFGACTSPPPAPSRAEPGELGIKMSEVESAEKGEAAMMEPADLAAATPTDIGLPPPTAEHTMLQHGVGTWEGTVTMFAPGMPAEPQPAKETVWALGAYWTQSRFACDLGTMKLHGSGVLGYDPVKALFVGTWIDNFTSELVVMEGTAGADGKSMSMHFTARDPQTGVPTKHRIDTVFAGDTYVSTFFHGEGEGTKSMVIEMKRVGGAK